MNIINNRMSIAIDLLNNIDENKQYRKIRIYAKFKLNYLIKILNEFNLNQCEYQFKPSFFVRIHPSLE